MISAHQSKSGLSGISTWLWWLALQLCTPAQTMEPAKSGYGKPALIEAADLEGFASLPADRRKLIESAIALARDSPWLPYTARGSAPSDGGFDCSGAMYYVMRRADLDPPRVSAAQFQWLEKNDRLHRVAAEATKLDHPDLKELRPGDLLFWGRPGERPGITHVAMFLGFETKDQRAVMINSTDGRSYRGVRANGYGVYDFRLPAAGSRVAFIGYGSPPGIAIMPANE